MTTLRQLEHFSLVYELGTVREAAEKAFVSQPAVTSSISKLENQLGNMLFVRTPAGMERTEFADQVFQRTRAILNGVNDLHRQAEIYSELKSGSLRLGVQQGVRQPVLQRFLPRFIARYPDLSYSVIERTSGELVRLLLNDEIDLIVAGYRGLEDSEHIRTVHLKPLVLTPIVRGSHPLTRKKSVSLTNLLEYPMAAPETVPSHLPIYQKLRDANRSSHGIPHISCSDYRILTEVVMTTDTFMVGSRDEFVDELAAGRLSVLEVSGFSMKYLVAVVDRIEQFQPPAVTEFIKQLKSHLS